MATPRGGRQAHPLRRMPADSAETVDWILSGIDRRGDPMTLKGKAKTKGPSPIDIHVGSRMRMRRMALGMSQEKLAKTLGLTFQKVQKYERGANRMASSQLQQAADVLGVAAAFFFEGAGGGPYGSAPSPAYIDRVLVPASPPTPCKTGEKPPGRQSVQPTLR